MNIIARRDDEAIEGEWEFHVSFNLDFSGETQQLECLVGGLQMGMGAKLEGKGKGKMVDLVKLQKKEDKEREEKGISPTPTIKAVPIHEEDPNMVRNSKTGPSGRACCC